MPEQRAGGVGHFMVMVDGVEIGYFTEVSGLVAELKIEEITEGGQDGFIHKVPTRVKWPNLILKRGVTTGDELFEWFNEVANGVASGQGFSRKSGSVVAINDGTDKVRQWDFDGAVPVKWTGPSFQAGGTQVQIEELEIAHHGFRAA